MLNWLWTRQHRIRLTQYHEMIDMLLTPERDAPETLSGLALIFPIVVSATAQKTGHEEAVILDPTAMTMSNRLACIAHFSAEDKRLQTQPKGDSLTLTYESLGILEVMHLLRFYQADIPTILPAETEGLAMKLSCFVHRLHTRGVAQVRQLGDDTPPQTLH